MKWHGFVRKPVGYVDHISDHIVRGWVWLPSRPLIRLRLDFFYRDVFLGQSATGLFRADLQANKIGDGRHGFAFHLPADARDPAIGPADIRVIAQGPSPVVLPHSSGSSSPSRAPPGDAKSFFLPYLATLKPLGGEHTTTPGHRTKIDAICAPLDDGSASAFAQHIADKYDRPGPADGDPAAFWTWYIGSYAMEQGPARVPLAREDIDRLMRPDPAGRAFVVGLFADRSEAGLQEVERRYRWAIEESRRLSVEDCLVSQADIDALRAVPSSQKDRDYPLSTFMVMLRQRHPVLERVPASTESGRKKLYALIMLLALRSPHYLAYVPGAWMRQALDLANPRKSPFDDALTELFGPSGTIDAALYREYIAAAGFDIESQSFSGTRYRGHRVLGGPAVVMRPAPVDIQMIGPLRRESGLGESCRRIGAALEMTRFSTNIVPYEKGKLDYDATHGRLRPARLNILHLNAEEIPEAFAYLPEVFSDSRTVAIPYWELDKPVAPHRLGLKIVDELWVASTYLGDVFGSSTRSVKWIGMSYDAGPPASRNEGLALRGRYGIASTTFSFLTTSDAQSWVQRKNPLAVIDAFQAAFTGREPVALIVKTHNLQRPLSDSQKHVWNHVRARCGADPRIVLIDETFERRRHRALVAGCDAFVSLHRAEGLGLDLIDAMALGIPLIATAYSGNMDFCSEETAWLVDFDLSPVRSGDYGFVESGHRWAEPRMASAAAALKGVYERPSHRIERADRGQAFVRRHASPNALAARLAQRIEA